MVWVLRAIRAVRPAKTTHSTIRSDANRQLIRSEIGSRTSSEMNDERWSRKNPTHSPHNVSVPCSITFINRPEWVLP